MKKISIISIFVFFAVITFMAFTFNTAADIQKSSINNSGDQILVHVIGCDNCKNINVCVNGHISYNFKTCDFYIPCDPASLLITICVSCENGSGSVTVTCPNNEVKIKVDASGTACPCDSKKKK